MQISYLTFMEGSQSFPVWNSPASYPTSHHVCHCPTSIVLVYTHTPVYPTSCVTDTGITHVTSRNTRLTVNTIVCSSEYSTIS